jgi:hypothetical protein
MMSWAESWKGLEEREEEWGMGRGGREVESDRVSE